MTDEPTEVMQNASIDLSGKIVRDTNAPISITRKDFRYAFGQAFCSEKNQHKEMDADLGIELERILFGEKD